MYVVVVVVRVMAPDRRQEQAPHTTVALNGAKLQVYELTKTGGYAFSIERLPLPTMVRYESSL